MTKPFTTSATAFLRRQPALHAIEQVSSEIFDVVASCSNTAEEFFASMHGTVHAALVPNEQRVAVGEVARVRGAAMRRDQAAIGVLRLAGRDALGDDPAGGVLSEMDHLGARVGRPGWWPFEMAIE